MPLDPGVSGFRLVLDGVRDEAPPSLLSPDGESAELTSGDQTLAGAELSSSTRDGLTMVDLAFPSGGSPGGRWILDTKATPDRISVVDLYYFWGVGLEVRAPEGLTIGATSPVEAVLTYPDGSAVEPDTFQTLTLTMTIDGENVALAPSEPGVFSGTLSVPGQGAPSGVDVAVVAEAVSNPSSVGLGPVSVSARLSTVLPPAFATLVTSELSMPQIVADGATGGALQFEGSEDGETRVCVDDIEVSGPETAGAITVTSESECLAIGTAASVEWPISVTPEQASDGRIEGVITLNMTAVDGVDTITVDVPFNASMMRPVNEPLRWGLVAALVLVGLLLPVAIAWLTNFFNGTYRVSSRTVQANAPVRLSAKGLAPTGRKSLLTIDDFEGLRISGQRRLSKVDGVVRLRRRLPWWPFGEVKYEAVSSSTSAILLSSREPYRRGSLRAPAESNFRQVFFLQVSLPSSPAEEYEARLALIDEDDPDLSTVIRRREEQVADFRDWDVLVDLITQEVERRAAKDAPSKPAQDRAAESPAGATVSRGDEPDTDSRPPSLWGESPGGTSDRPVRGGAGGGRAAGQDLWRDDDTPPPKPNIREKGDRTPADRSDKPRSIFDD